MKLPSVAVCALLLAVVRVVAGETFFGPFPSWENVRAHGAVGDGIADDTAAIGKALEVVLRDEAKGVLYFPAGTYRITATLDVP